VKSEEIEAKRRDLQALEGDALKAKEAVAGRTRRTRSWPRSGRKRKPARKSSWAFARRPKG
jgi:hypothetical protein